MTQLLPFMLGEERYGLKLTDIQEIIEEARTHYLPAAPENIIGAVNVHGRILPVIHLSGLLGFSQETYSERMIVLDRRELPVALAVRRLEPLLSVDLEQATLTQSDAPDDCISGVLNWCGQMISLLDLGQLRTIIEEKCSTPGGGHVAARTDR